VIPKLTNLMLALRGKSFCEVRLDLKIHDPMLASVTRNMTTFYFEVSETIQVTRRTVRISANSLVVE